MSRNKKRLRRCSSYLQEEAPDSWRYVDDMETHLQEQRKRLARKEHLRVTLVCASSSSKRTQSAARRPRRRFGRVTFEEAQRWMKSHVFLDDYQDEDVKKEESHA